MGEAPYGREEVLAFLVAQDEDGKIMWEENGEIVYSTS